MGEREGEGDERCALVRWVTTLRVLLPGRHGAERRGTDQLGVLAEHAPGCGVGWRAPLTAAALKLRGWQVDVNRPALGVDSNAVPVLKQGYGPANGRLRGDMAHDKAVTAA